MINIRKPLEKYSIQIYYSKSNSLQMNKTAIIDHGKKRCFVFDLNRKHISSPRSLFELLHGMIKGTFGINFQQIREDMELKFPAVDNFDEYG